MMNSDSESAAREAANTNRAESPLYLFWTVGDLKAELGSRIQKLSGVSPATIAERLEMAYYEKILRFIEPLPPGTQVNSGTSM